MNHLTKRLTIFLILYGVFFAFVAHAQVVPNNLWHANNASGTISPNNSALQVPCANIVGGCASTSTAVTSVNSATGTVTIAGTGTGTVSTTVTTSGNTITVSSSLPQSIATNATPTFAGITVSGSASSSIGTTLTASTNEQGLDHGTYVNTLCKAGLTNASSVLINFPQEIISTTTGYQWTVPIVDTFNGGVCTYTGVGPQGTEWYWNGSTTTAATSENGGDANAHWGYGMNNLSIFGNYIASSTGLLIGGPNPGGGQGFSNNNLVIKYFQWDESIATNTYLGQQFGGIIGAASSTALIYNSVTNAGEGLLFDHVTFADTVQSSSTVQNCIVSNGGFSQIEWTNDHFDDCGTEYNGGGAGTAVYLGSYWENTLGDTIGAYIPIVNNSSKVTIDTYGGQYTQDASNSVPTAFINNAGVYNNYGMTGYQNSTGTLPRWVSDTGTGQDFLYGFSNPNGLVASYKSVTPDGGLIPFISATANNDFPFQMKFNSSTAATTIYDGDANTKGTITANGWTLAGTNASGTPTVQVRGSSAQSSTLMIGDATHYGCTEWGTPSGLVYQYATTTAGGSVITTTTKPTINICL